MRRALPILGLWCALSIGLAALTTRVADWFAMPNELLYERRAISVAQNLSRAAAGARGARLDVRPALSRARRARVPLGRHAGQPLGRARAERVDHGVGLHPGVPARAPGDRRALDPVRRRRARGRDAVDPARVVPAHRGRGVPGVRLGRARDAGLGRGAVAAPRPARARSPSRSRSSDEPSSRCSSCCCRSRSSPSSSGAPAACGRPCAVAVDRHRLLAWVYGVLAAVGIGLAVAGKLPSTLGVYGATIGGTGASVSETVAPSGIGGSLVEHVATFSLGLGILPFVVGAAWLLANLVRPPRAASRTRSRASARSRSSRSSSR